jgi:hypothetical protein
LLIASDLRRSISTRKDGLPTSGVSPFKPLFVIVNFCHVIEYVKKLKAKLEEQGKADRVPAFQKGATALVKHIMEKFDEVQIFSGESYDMEASFAYCYYVDQSD